MHAISSGEYTSMCLNVVSGLILMPSHGLRLHRPLMTALFMIWSMVMNGCRALLLSGRHCPSCARRLMQLAELHFAERRIVVVEIQFVMA